MTKTVTLQPGGIEIEVQDGETILEAGLRRGLDLLHSCRSGNCMACQAQIVRGEVAYRHGQPAGLSDEERQQGKTLLCQAEPLGAVEVQTLLVTGADIAPLRRLPCRIERLTPLAHDVMALHLRLPPVEPFVFRAGQYIDLLLEDGDSRSFSLANPPHDAGLLELHVRRVPNGRFTDRVFETMRAKDLLRMMGPLGNFYVRHDSARPLLMLAGGTGFAPIQSMLLDLVERGDRRPVRLYWGVRSRRDLYADELAKTLVARHPNLTYVPVLSEPADSDDWDGRTGFVHRAAMADCENLAEFDVYMSGPPPMVAAARDDMLPRGLRDERLFFDAFEFSPRVQAAIEGSAPGRLS